MTMDTSTSRSRAARHASLSSRQLREIRKELLITRAAVERIAIIESKIELSQGMSRFGWLGILMPGFLKRAHVGDGDALLSAVPAFLRPGLQALLPMLRRHPLSAALLSFLVGLPSGGSLKKATGSVKWAGAAMVSLKAYRLWRRVVAYRAARAARRAERSAMP
jgi:hypothetical protein